MSALQESYEAKPSFEQRYTDQVVDLMREGQAPWQKPWEAGKRIEAAFNPNSGHVYNGFNAVSLALAGAARGLDDPRWIPRSQVLEDNLPIRKGAKAETLLHYQWEKKMPVMDERGELALDADGQALHENVRLERPVVRRFSVFNAGQLAGVPPHKPDREMAGDATSRADLILSASGVAIRHDQAGNAHGAAQAFYSYKDDAIHMPSKESYSEPGAYYSAAFHALARSTSHPDRLNRHVGSAGSPAYAAEELRAEIASWMICATQGIPRVQDEKNAFLTKSMIKALEQDPQAIFRICRDAEKIMNHVLGMYRQADYDITAQEDIVNQRAQTREYGAASKEAFDRGKPERAPNGHPLLIVPFAEKDMASDAGAKWNIEKRYWFAPAEADLSRLEQWLATPEKIRVQAGMPSMPPEREFARMLEAAGLNLGGKLPVMDGEIHRVPLADDKAGERNAAYCGYADGRANGWAHNFTTNERTKWVSTGHVLSDEQKAAFRLENEQRRLAREQERAAVQNRVAGESAELLAAREAASPGHKYLCDKLIEPLGNVRESADKKHLLVPVQNVKGEIRGFQAIGEDGDKAFVRGCQKKGCFCPIAFDEPGRKKGRKSSLNGRKDTILIAEGYATGASLHMATGKPVIVAFDAGNLKPVAEAVRAANPGAQIVFCADCDHAHGVGQKKAEEAALAVGGIVAAPSFSKAQTESLHLSDFNDLHRHGGLDAVKKQVGAAIDREKRRPAAGMDKGR